MAEEFLSIQNMTFLAMQLNANLEKLIDYSKEVINVNSGFLKTNNPETLKILNDYVLNNYIEIDTIDNNSNDYDTLSDIDDNDNQMVFNFDYEDDEEDEDDEDEILLNETIKKYINDNLEKKVMKIIDQNTYNEKIIIINSVDRDWTAQPDPYNLTLKVHDTNNNKNGLSLDDQLTNYISITPVFMFLPKANLLTDVSNSPFLILSTNYNSVNEMRSTENSLNGPNIIMCSRQGGYVSNNFNKYENLTCTTLKSPRFNETFKNIKLQIKYPDGTNLIPTLDQGLTVTENLDSTNTSSDVIAFSGAMTNHTYNTSGNFGITRENTGIHGWVDGYVKSLGPPLDLSTSDGINSSFWAGVEFNADTTTPFPHRVIVGLSSTTSSGTTDQQVIGQMKYSIYLTDADNKYYIYTNPTDLWGNFVYSGVFAPGDSFAIKRRPTSNVLDFFHNGNVVYSNDPSNGGEAPSTDIYNIAVATYNKNPGVTQVTNLKAFRYMASTPRILVDPADSTNYYVVVSNSTKSLIDPTNNYEVNFPNQSTLLPSASTIIPGSKFIETNQIVTSGLTSFQNFPISHVHIRKDITTVDFPHIICKVELKAGEKLI